FPPPFAGCCFRVDCLSFLNPQLHVVHVSSHASNVVGYVSWMMCPTLLAASWISCCACLSARWLRKWSHDRSEPVIHSCVYRDVGSAVRAISSQMPISMRHA